MSLSKERRDERKVLAMKANEGRYIPLHKLYEIAAESGALLADLDEAEDLALQRHRASEHWHAECVKLKADLARASSQITHWRNNHDNVLAKLRLFTQREDLPVDRIPAYQHVLDLERQLAEAQAQMQNVNDCFDAAADEGLFERIAECGHSPGDGSLADLVQRRLLFAPKTEPHIALSAAIADAVEPYKRDAERLDLLIQSGATVQKDEGQYFLCWDASNRGGPLAETPRLAIDAALAAKEKEHG